MSYQCYLREDQWSRIKDLLPGREGKRGVRARDNRKFIEAILWIGRTGARWRALPPEYGHWHRVFVRFSRWCKTGVWDQLMQHLRQDADMEESFIDSTAIRAHQHAAGALKKMAHRLWAVLAADGAVKST
jgi:transposase